MARNTRIGEGRRGWLLIVTASCGAVLCAAAFVYQHALERSKDTLLKNNLFTLQTVVDEYTFDKHEAPRKMQDLVSEGYLRSVPLDPFTGKQLGLEDVRNSEK